MKQKCCALNVSSNAASTVAFLHCCVIQVLLKNCSIELAHNHMRKFFGKGQNVWKFIEKLKTESLFKQADYFAAKAGQQKNS
jgi:hypothetical protein